MAQRFGFLTQEQQQEIVEAINARASSPEDPCPNCGKGPSALVEASGRVGFAYMDGRPEAATPTVATVCQHCGFIRQYAARVLGLSFSLWPSSTSLEEEQSGG